MPSYPHETSVLKTVSTQNEQDQVVIDDGRKNGKQKTVRDRIAKNKSTHILVLVVHFRLNVSSYRSDDDDDDDLIFNDASTHGVICV